MNILQVSKFSIPVDNKLLRGRAIYSPRKFKELKADGVTQIIDLRHAPSITKFIEKLMCKLFGIKYINQKYSHKLSTLPEDNFFKEITQKIKQNPQKTYIHCEKGKRRTGLFVAYYEKDKGAKTQTEIIKEMIDLGFYDLANSGRRIERYKKILEQFQKKYFTDTNL